MKVLEHEAYRTEYGVEADGRYRIRQFVRGNLILDVAGPTKDSALNAARILSLHELVRRDDIRASGRHESCEGCVFEAEVLISTSR